MADLALLDAATVGMILARDDLAVYSEDSVRSPLSREPFPLPASSLNPQLFNQTLAANAHPCR